MLAAVGLDILAIVYVLYQQRDAYLISLLPYLFAIGYFKGIDLANFDSFLARMQIIVVSTAMIMITWSTYLNFSSTQYEYVAELILPSIIILESVFKLLYFLATKKSLDYQK